MDPQPPLLLEGRDGRIHLLLRAVPMGSDLTVTLSGGDRPHIGAVALASPGQDPALETPVIALPGHREDQLAQTLARRLSGALGASVCVACGIHLEAIRREEILAVGTLADQLARELLERLRSSG